MLARETTTTLEIRTPDPTLTAAVPTPATQQVRLQHVLCLLCIYMRLTISMPQKLVCNNVPHAHAAEPDDKWSALLDTMTKTRAASVAGVVPAACLMLHLHRCSSGQLLAGFGSR